MRHYNPPVFIQHPLRNHVPCAPEEIVVVTAGSGFFYSFCFSRHPLRQAVLDHLVYQLQQEPDLYFTIRLLRPLGVESILSPPDLHKKVPVTP